ncbi:Probable inactive leucine-rich repeat receptor-like protein kinase At3g03770 [Linum perenne]
MAHHSFILLPLLITWISLLQPTHQLQSSQTQVLLQLRKHLEYPTQLDFWNYAHGTDLCYMQPSRLVNVSCQDNSVTELRIMGDKPSKLDNHTLSPSFSMDSFVATLARLNSLRVLTLVSLGIWGPLPDKIHRLGLLEHLDLSSNHLFGAVPPKISTMVKLQTLILDDNFFNSTLPSSFDSLSNLTVLSLRNNHVNGPLQSLEALTSLQVLDLSLNNFDSDLPSLPKGLLMAILSNNSFSGKIPKGYSQLSQLQHLDMSFNELIGTAPSPLFALDNIRFLNLASNMLGGSLPDSLRCGRNLQFVDISSNRLTGRLPSCLATGSADKRLVLKLVGNCLSSSLNQQHPESACTEVPLAVEGKKQSEGKRNLGVLVGLVAGIVGIVAVLAFGFVLVYRRYLSREVSEQHLLHKGMQEDSVTGFASELLSSARFISQASKVGSQGLPACRSFSVEELKKATNNFDNSAVLGQGHYGKLYKGRLEDGTQVAIRCLPTSKKYTTRNLKLRLDLLAKLRHPNLVCLLGHCIDNGGEDDYRVDQVFLVYEHICYGNFQTQVFGKAMNWPERLAALTGVAKAVHFLHTGVIPGFFNNRLKTHNILLNEHGMAKLSDYGLSIVSDHENRDSADNEGLGSWQPSKVEDDIHGFGFILLESLVGSPVCAERDKFLAEKLASCTSQESRAKLMNPTVLATASQESLTTVISITDKCISPESVTTRPSLEDILWNLQYAGQIQAASDEQSVVVVAQR